MDFDKINSERLKNHSKELFNPSSYSRDKVLVDIHEKAERIFLSEFGDSVFNVKVFFTLKLKDLKNQLFEHFNFKFEIRRESYKYFLFEEKIIVSFEVGMSRVIYDKYLPKKKIGILYKIIRNVQYKSPQEDSGEVNILTQGVNDFGLHKYTVIKKDIDIQSHYNDDFLKINNIIENGLEDKNSPSLVLLQSEPGVGKTYYIRYLTKSIKKEFVYIPPGYSDLLVQPNFIKYAADELQDTIVVIEDAENILKSRGYERSTQSISNLLNLSDGLLKDLLNIKFICTINCPMGEIDQALLRKGRLLAKHELQKLSVEKSNALLKKLGVDYVTQEPMKLSDIYNFDKESFESEKIKVGF